MRVGGRSAVGRLRGAAPGDEAIHRRARAVDVGPGPLLSGPLVLLEGPVAGGHDAGQVLRLFAEGVARGAEVEQQRRALGAQVDVGGLHVAVQHAGAVHDAEALEHRDHDAQHLGLLELLLLAAHEGVEGLALLVVHHEVGGAVALHVVGDAHDARVPELGEGAGLLEEALQPELVLVGDLLAARRDRRRLGLAHGELDRQVLLQGHVGLEPVVPGLVGDPEAPGAELGEDLVIPDSRARPERVLALRHRCASAPPRAAGVGGREV